VRFRFQEVYEVCFAIAVARDFRGSFPDLARESASSLPGRPALPGTHYLLELQDDNKGEFQTIGRLPDCRTPRGICLASSAHLLVEELELPHHDETLDLFLTTPNRPLPFI